MKNLKSLFIIILSVILFGCDSDNVKENTTVLSSEKELTEFKFENPNNYELNRKDSVFEFIYNTDMDLTNLKPSITVSKAAKFTPENHTNFKSEVKYTVTAEDKSTKEYFVRAYNHNEIIKVSLKKELNKQLKKDYVLENDITNIEGGIDLKLLVPSIEVHPDFKLIEAVDSDFSNPVSFKVKSKLGTELSFDKKVISATKPPVNPETKAKILSFTIPAATNDWIDTDINANITYEKDPNTSKTIGKITAQIPHKANINYLKTKITVSSGSDYTPKNQTSFLYTVYYDITNSDDNSSIRYEVKITKHPAPVPSDKKIITSFKYEASKNPGMTEDLIYTIDQDAKTIIANVAHDYDVSILKNYTIEYEAARIDIEPHFDHNSVKWGITLFDENKKWVIYHLSTIKAKPPVVKSSEKELLSFGFKLKDNSELSVINSDLAGVINQQNRTVEFHLSDKISITNLKPYLSISNKATTSAIVASDFTNPVTYTITAEDGTTKDYTISIKTYKDFISKWKTTSANQSITLPMQNTIGLPGYYDCWINWGDGSPLTHITSKNVNATRKHIYTNSGEHTITISGKAVSFNFSTVPASKDKILDITQWGDLHIGTRPGHFRAAKNLIITANDSPDLKYIGSMRMSFAEIPNLKINNFDNWDFKDCSSMERMFIHSTHFDQRIYNMTTVKVNNMAFMFYGTEINNPISLETRAVTTMESMFEAANSFNQRLNFYTAHVKSMKNMFREARNYNQPIDFNITSLENAEGMFNYAINFNSSVRFTGQSHRLVTTSMMFASATKFNQPISFGNNPEYTTGLKNVSGMFANASAFNSRVEFNTENVEHFYSMFSGSNFNQPIDFNTKSAKSMNSMFMSCPFNQSLPKTFTTANVNNMEQMFCHNTAFNQDIKFDVSNVSNFESMFFRATKFNSALVFTNLGKVQTNMRLMFYDADKFNYDISDWDVSKVTNVQGMFQAASSFNQDISSWKFNLIAKDNINGISDDFDDGAGAVLTPQWGNN
ncbi:MAG: BspA family leucine-rich repeat surface protein [Marinifilaceae bacterium]|jgi:surface protein|nr:BspA family leucine-rich repeat surface protein [Marinifilaceae bacterium]